MNTLRMIYCSPTRGRVSAARSYTTYHKIKTTQCSINRQIGRQTDHKGEYMISFNVHFSICQHDHSLSPLTAHHKHSLFIRLGYVWCCNCKVTRFLHHSIANSNLKLFCFCFLSTHSAIRAHYKFASLLGQASSQYKTLQCHFLNLYSNS